MCILEVALKDLLSKLCFYVYFFPQYWNFSSCGLLFVLDISHISFFFFFSENWFFIRCKQLCFILEIGLFL